MDSSFKVCLTKVLKVEDHPGADRLSIATVYGFQVITSKNLYAPGDLVIYAPIDSVLDEKLEAILFPPEAKVKLNKGRVRQIKLRGIASQGLLINPKDITTIVNPEYLKEEQDLSSVLNIKKYEPPTPAFQNIPASKAKQRKNLPNPYFHSYNGLTHLKWLPNLFEGKEVVIQLKLHGTNARAGILPKPKRNLFDKIKNFFGLLPKYEFVYGSNNVDITNSSSYTGYYNDDIYGKTFKAMNVYDKLKPNEIVYGEIIGPGVQKNYDYSLKEHKFILFDVKMFNEDGTHYWLDPEAVEVYAKARGFEMIPILYKGIYNYELARQLSMGVDDYDPNTKVKEGVVIKLRTGYSLDGNKQALKLISEDYLADKNNSDNH